MSQTDALRNEGGTGVWHSSLVALGMRGAPGAGAAEWYACCTSSAAAAYCILCPTAPSDGPPTPAHVHYEHA
eukprot:1152342-Pelagomonas_calceolata.AAC.1